MTKNWFEDNITEWDELFDFCDQYGCYILEDLIKREDLDDYIAQDLANYAMQFSWTDIRYWLNDIDDDCDVFLREDCFEYNCLDYDDFDSLKREVAEWMDEEDLWDGDEEDEEEADDECDDEYSDIIEDVSIDELLGVGSKNADVIFCSC